MAHRIDGDGAVADLNGAGRNGFTQTPPNETQVTADWLNDWQENLARAIELAGITLVKGTFTQLYDAIVALIVTGVAGKVTGPASATDNALARFDATTGKLVQNSVVRVSDTGSTLGITDLAISGALSGATGVASDAFTYNTPVARTILVPVTSMMFDSAAYDYSPGSGTSEIIALGAQATACMDINAHVPAGATITGIRVLVDPANAAVMFFRAHRRTVSGTTVTVAFTVGPHNSDGTTNIQWIASGTISLLGAAGTTRELEVVASNPTGTGDKVLMIEISYTDTGPINAA